MTTQFVVSVLTLLIVSNLVMLSVMYSIQLERKIASWVQDRIGPNRTGFSFGLDFMPRFHFWGLGQPLADGLKMLIKEDYTPPSVDKKLFILAPLIVIVPALMGWAVIPWGGYWDCQGITIPSWLPFLGGWEVCEPGKALVSGANISVGVLYILAIGSVAVYGVVVGAYASNNKYSFLGGLRATAQMLSYEIPLSLTVLTIILASGTARPDLIVELQANHVWNIFVMPVSAVIFFTCNLAETNRAPFDLAECEQELVGGYHTEYSSMKFGLFLLGEYIHIITGSAFFTLLFLGGWDIPFIHEPTAAGLAWVALKMAAFAFKIFLLVSLVMVVRWSLPRFRFDQLMRLAWRGMIPISLGILLSAGVIIFLAIQGYLFRIQVPWLIMVANAFVALIAITISPFMPEGATVNRRVPLAGSRFMPLTTTQT